MRFAELSVCALALTLGCGGSKHAPVDLGLGDDLSGQDLSTLDLWGTGPFDLTGADFSIAGSATNVASVIVDAGPVGNAFNEPFVSIKLCAPGSTTNCQTIDHIEIDTGSVGLHIMASVINSTLLSALPPTMSGGNPVTECYAYASDTVYGTVRTADVTIGGETAPSVTFMAAADAGYIDNIPTSCSSANFIDKTVGDLAANGVMGIGLFNPDCGTSCNTAFSAQHPTNPIYYGCATTSTCAPVGVPNGSQLENPIALLPAPDNNGVIIELPPISDDVGALNPVGSLVLGIGTQSNNQIMGETVLLASTNEGDLGSVLTQFAGEGFKNSFFDSGSGELFFPNSTIPNCGGQLTGFFCPTTTEDFTAVVSGSDGKSTDARFKIANAQTLFGAAGNATAIDDIAINASNMGFGIGSFDWGLTFFFGHRMFSAIQGASTPYGVGPFYAF